jgi:hypothetical protein
MILSLKRNFLPNQDVRLELVVVGTKKTVSALLWGREKVSNGP